MTHGPTARRPVWSSLAAALLIPGLLLACEGRARRERSQRASDAREAESSAPYQAEVDEGLGAAVAILVDTSGSMKDRAPGESRPKYLVARESLEAMLDATDAFVAKRPDFPIKIGIYSFSSAVRTLRPIQPYDRAAIREALAQLPEPGGGTAIGDEREARCASQLRQTVHGAGCPSSGSGTSPTSISRIDARHAATDRCIGAPDEGGSVVRMITPHAASPLRFTPFRHRDIAALAVLREG